MKPYICNQNRDKVVLLLTNKADIKSEALGEYVPSKLLESFAKYINAKVVILPVIFQYCEKETKALVDKYRYEVYKTITEVNPDVIVLLGKTAGESLFIDYKPTVDLGKSQEWESVDGRKIKVFFSISPNFILKVGKEQELRNLFLVGDLVNTYLNRSLSLPFQIIQCEDVYEFMSFLKLLKQEEIVAIDYETPTLENLDIVSVGLAYGKPPLIKAFAFRITNTLKKILKEFVLAHNCLVAHNAKFEHKVNIVNFGETRFLEDTMLMLNFVDETSPSNLEFLSNYCGLGIEWKKDFWTNPEDLQSEELLTYNATDAAVTLVAYYKLKEELAGRLESYRLFASYALSVAVMELNGLYLKADYELLGKFERAVEYLEKKIGFNVRSRKALESYLIDKLNIKCNRTEKGNYSFTTKFLLNHPDERVEIVGQIKQIHSYIQFIKQYIERRDEKGLVHTTYLQARTRTGRLASQNPNLQNVPKNLLRKFFVSRFGDKGVLIEADYNQLEPRILATLSKDKLLLELFEKGMDLHSFVASLVFHKNYEHFIEEINSGNEQYTKMRYVGKQMNLGIMYGLTAHGLAKRTNLPEEEAERIIKTYYSKFHGVKEFQRKCLKSLKENCYVEDLFGRRRHLLPDDKKAKRQAINFPVTSTGNQCCQMAATAFVKRNKNPNIVLCANIHDALLVDCKKEYIDEAVALLLECMDLPNRFLICKLTVEIKYGDGWYELRKYQGNKS